MTASTGFQGSAQKTASTQGGFKPLDWARLISDTAVSGSKSIGSKKEAKQAKKKTYAELLRNAMKRNVDLYRSGSAFSQDVVDYQNQALQEIARGFADSMRGATTRGR